ncbi:MAG: DNA-directed RNA polymerase subunit alpha [Acidobacteria bacterium]|nr:DNA-directed RNA polymerase subunit alpha [Acidobacteriota bacterium]
MLWKGFQRPKRLECDPESLTPHYGKFWAQPFERGFGTTIGNALRRVLLSSVEGAAITAVKIDGILHEFSSVPGVLEDTIDLILNLKQIPIKINVSHPETIYLRAEGAMEVKSGHIESNPNVEILDSDVHIATLSEEGRLNMELRVKPGRGYISADRNYDTDLAIGYIPIDSVHSPVRKVSYVVEDARLGQTTDYDKLTMEVWTNGTASPESAMALASKLLKDHLSIFINFEEVPEMDDQAIDREKEHLRENLMRSIEELELSVRSYNCLKNAEIKSIADLVQHTEADMLKTKNFGRKSLNEIKELLAGMGLSLGMQVDHILQPTEE